MHEIRVPQILAIYLPQFYETEDNNLWYGKGFTDWVAVKDAESCFENHYQPRIPLDNNYYDLTKKETLQWQVALAKRYGIDGFCFYHYYFKDGKKELEIPAENLLRWKDIDMPFCFNWASSSWVRSWSRFGGNSWADKYDLVGSETTSEVLVEQKFGSEQDWKKHFDYLLPFFLDSRYICIDGKPVFIFLNATSIFPLDEMATCWRDEALKAGLNGLYLIGNSSGMPLKSMDAYMIYEPANSLSRYRERHDIPIINGVKCFSYKTFWEEILKTPPFAGKKTYFCGLSGYDTTPRRGTDGEVLVDATPEIFKAGLTKLIQKSMKQENEVLFLDAWNEWGEGMYLEPDARDGEQYLSAVKDAISNAKLHFGDYVDMTTDSAEEQLQTLSLQLKRMSRLFATLNRWCVLQEEGKLSIKGFLRENNATEVAIYGLGVIGKHLIFHLKRENITIKYAIDRYASLAGENFRVYRPGDTFPNVDLVVITAYDNGEIARHLREKGLRNIVYLEELLYRLEAVRQEERSLMQGRDS